MDKVRYAIDTVVVQVLGNPVTLHAGETWAADDPVVVEHPSLFAAKPSVVRRTVQRVEQATAAPGQRR